MYLRNLCNLIWLLFIAGCSALADSKKTAVVLNNSTDISNENFEQFLCEELLNDNVRINSIDKNVNPLYDAFGSASNENYYSVVTLHDKTSDSVWVNIETFKIGKHNDTIRIGNFGGRTFANDKDVISNIRKTICRFLNK